MIAGRPRFTDRAFPPYSYLPGHAPHPVSDPTGHMAGEHPPEAPALDPNRWQRSEEYLFGCDLLNHGYYWEAHEAWESLWHAAGRAGEVANFLKGLIKLAAAGVKAREGNPRGVARHSNRALELLTAQANAVFCGLELSCVCAQAEKLREIAGSFARPQPDLVLDLVVLPSSD